ncbi:hypothetical protein MBLNU230_g6569t1 [Neophaeotheca triangularis]
MEQQTVKPVDRPLDLIPVGLKEAALDSPTFRATSLHFSDQIEIIERWLDGYLKAASRLVNEVSSLESLINTFLLQSVPPAQVSEAVLDHDYTMLAMQRYGEGSREFWQHTLRGIKKYDTAVVEPIKAWMSSDLRAFKEARRTLEGSQKAFDSVISRYLGQGKSKEASSLREDAFQLHESRKAYLKASMDFCVQAPNLRSSLDKLLVRIFSDQWKEMRASRDGNNMLFSKWGSEMERVRGWSKELENSDRAFKRELLTARKQIEESAETMNRPSRELEDYSASTVPYLGTGAQSAVALGATAKEGQSERRSKQGWLFMRTTVGKPARTLWSRRWFYVKNGIFGWLVQGPRSGGVEESERIGVLLCSVRPAFQEERRFCFEVKTKDQSIILQAETQPELTEWLGAFDIAKRQALENPASTDSSIATPGTDPAFAITAPTAPEFAAKNNESHMQTSSEDASTSNLALPDREGTGLSSRSSFDVTSNRRVMSMDREHEGTRDRLMSKLDLSKRSGASTAQSLASGGIASLISASHNILPVGPGSPAPASSVSEASRRSATMPISSLAPSTLANPPAPTNLSHTAVVVSGERGLGLGRNEGVGMPSGIMANLWGSNTWGYVNRIGDSLKANMSNDSSEPLPAHALSKSRPVSMDDSTIMDGEGKQVTHEADPEPRRSAIGHRKTISLQPGADVPNPKASPPIKAESNEYPNYYPLPLKAQQAQFRMLFPNIPASEKVVLVFRASWNPNEHQEFPGRVYVTTRDIYFYSNHLGLVLITGVSLTAVGDVTAAPGRDCDFLFLHMRETAQTHDDPRRITIKTFLEPLRLLQRRLNYLSHNADADVPDDLEEVLKTMIKMEAEAPKRSTSAESWEDVNYSQDDSAVPGDPSSPQRRRERDVRASLRIDGNLFGDPIRTGREVQKFKLPSQPVVYAPSGMTASLAKEFNVSAKALFHVMFGDKSAVFQVLYINRWANDITQTPWALDQPGGHWSRSFTSANAPITQTIDIFNDHLCYVATSTRRPWGLPYSSSFTLTTKYVITHSTKSRCKLAIYDAIQWSKRPLLPYIRHLIEKRALDDLAADDQDLTNVATDQVAKLGSHSKTNKAVEIFGNIGQLSQPSQLTSTSIPALSAALTPRASPRPKTLPSMLADDALTQAFALFTSFFDILISLGKTFIGVCTAHTLLVAILALSALYNTYHGYRDATVWYHERSAGKFMQRLGIHPDPVMGRAVYLRDLEQFVTPGNGSFDALAHQESDETTSSCRAHFAEELLTTSVSTSISHSAERLQTSRSALARYRHDLLVALRVVNRVERDVVEAEWGEWVRGEASKCERVEGMVLRKKFGEGAKKGKKGKGKGYKEGEVEGLVREELGQGFVEYCRDCRGEVEGLVAVGGLM